MSTVKTSLVSIKDRLEKIELNLAKQSKQIDEREERWQKMADNIRPYKAQTVQKIFLNIGGVKYTTTLSTLISNSDCIFNKILSSDKINISEEIYIERRGDLFQIILEYLRSGKFNYRLYNKQKLLEIKEEADFFNLVDLFNEIDALTKDIEIINIEHSGDYIFKGMVAGSQKLEDLKTKDLTTGFCANTPGVIILELKGMCEFQEIEAAGFNGNKTLWFPGNGSGAKIYTSQDKVNWEHSGTLSSSFATKIATIKLKTKCFAKYIKFEHTSYIGFGYLFVKRTELN